MTTIRISTTCSLPPADVLRAAYDFSPRRVRIWPAVRAEHFAVHDHGETVADVTEGTPVGIGVNWERCRYDWSEPGRVTATVLASNVYAVPGSSWQITTAAGDPGSLVEMTWIRAFRRNPRGLLFGTLFRVAGKPIFGRYARQVLANLETEVRSADADSSRRGPDASGPPTLR
jgi:hypothetical protein